MRPSRGKEKLLTYQRLSIGFGTIALLARHQYLAYTLAAVLISDFRKNRVVLPSVESIEAAHLKIIKCLRGRFLRGFFSCYTQMFCWGSVPLDLQTIARSLSDLYQIPKPQIQPERSRLVERAWHCRPCPMLILSSSTLRKPIRFFSFLRNKKCILLPLACC